MTWIKGPSKNGGILYIYIYTYIYIYIYISIYVSIIYTIFHSPILHSNNSRKCGFWLLWNVNIMSNICDHVQKVLKIFVDRICIFISVSIIFVFFWVLCFEEFERNWYYFSLLFWPHSTRRWVPKTGILFKLRTNEIEQQFKT